jgi:hypothetical protein
VNEEVLWTWERFCFATTHVLLPMNFLGMDDELISIGYECEDGAPPLHCSDGSIVRRIVLTFPMIQEGVTWH